jgi:hypothetical protein
LSLGPHGPKTARLARRSKGETRQRPGSPYLACFQTSSRPPTFSKCRPEAFPYNLSQYGRASVVFRPDLRQVRFRQIGCEGVRNVESYGFVFFSRPGVRDDSVPRARQSPECRQVNPVLAIHHVNGFASIVEIASTKWRFSSASSLRKGPLLRRGRTMANAWRGITKWLTVR